MAIDYIVELDCEPKRHFGSGDCEVGSQDILERLKCAGRSAAIVELAKQEGDNPDELTITLRTVDQEGNPVEKEVTLGELEEEARPLESHGSACADCPANFQSERFGCFGFINYPLPAAGEQWLLGRVQPFGTLGAHLCLRFMAEFGVTGRNVRQMRKAGFFENSVAPKVTFKKRLLSRVALSADQLLEPVLLAGDRLPPSHCFSILLWLGAIAIDGKVPAGPEDEEAIGRLMTMEDCQEKRQHTRLELGPPTPSEGAVAFQHLVGALYLSWVNDVPLWMSV